jgi:hypothetical protein
LLVRIELTTAELLKKRTPHHYWRVTLSVLRDFLRGTRYRSGFWENCFYPIERGRSRAEDFGIVRGFASFVSWRSADAFGRPHFFTAPKELMKAPSGCRVHATSAGHVTPAAFASVNIAYRARAGSVVYVCAAPAGMRMPKAPIWAPNGVSNSMVPRILSVAGYLSVTSVNWV